MEPVRAFIAIELPNSVKSTLSQLQDDLKQSDHAPVKWIDSGSIHLTLKFLGNIAVGTTAELTRAISEAARGIAPFRLELGELGVFPNLRAPRVVWIGLGGEIGTLSVIQENIESALIPLGFSPERRAFSPHLTLGRVRERASPEERRRLGEAVSSLKMGAKLSFTVASLSLMRSRLTREGAVYSCLSSVALQSG
ncbi:MAG: RNA 2',3'-cyclic phosphodiesterase [Dehalococcoidia bacterium]|nr:MAG: RNA 2',3'-cyclic phosphodiesterase [Dehalococcoidia bacterium]